MKHWLFSVVSIMLGLSFLAGAESTQEVVDMVIKAGDSSILEAEVMAPKIQACPAGEIVPLFVKAYKEGDAGVQTRALWGMAMVREGDMLTEAFLECAVSGKETVNKAIWRLENRTLSRPMTPEESELFANEVRDGVLNGAGNAARNWAKLGPADPAQAAEIITEAFRKQIADPEIDKIPLLGGSHLNTRAAFLNRFLLAYRDLGEPAQAVLRGALEKVENDDTRAWLTMALSSAGDKDAARSLEAFIRDTEANTSMRVCAVCCYARGMKEEARPLLTEMLNDQSVTDNPQGDSGSIGPYDEPSKVVADRAHDALVRLDHPERGVY